MNQAIVRFVPKIYYWFIGGAPPTEVSCRHPS